jgi:hypothetical protein
VSIGDLKEYCERMQAHYQKKNEMEEDDTFSRGYAKGVLAAMEDVLRMIGNIKAEDHK